MRTPAPPARTAGLLLLLAAPAAPGATPREIVARAAEAHGGAARLARDRAERVRMQGKIIFNGNLVPFTANSTLQLPGRFKNVLQMGEGADKSHTLVQLINGDKLVVTVDGQPLQLPPPALAEIRMTLDVQRACRLVPLLNDRSYELAPAGEEKVNNRSADGVKVSAKGHKDLRLWFDRQTGLLLKTEHALEDGGGKEVLQEEFYGEFKEFGGVRRWTRVVVFRGGKKVLEAEVLDVRYPDRVDDAEFARP